MIRMSDFRKRLLEAYDFSELLLSLIESGRLQETSEVMKKLEDIIKAVFYTPGVIQESGKRLVNCLVRHQSH